MKAGQFFGKGLITAMVMSSAILFSSCNKDDDDNPSRTYAISGNASGSQVVPSVAGSGTGSISGTYDPNNRTLTYTTNWNGLTGVPTTGSFYTGASGVNGTAVGTPWTFGAGSTATGSTSGTMTLTDDQAASLTSGGWYYSYGTATNPAGEVRGQITAAQ
jgi:hypothetical protein